MHSRLLPTLLVLLLSAALAPAQEKADTTRKAATTKSAAATKPTPAPAASAEGDKTKKPSFLKRVFGGGKTKEKKAEAEKPAATPTATPRPRRVKREPAEKPSEAPEKETEKAPVKKSEPARKSEPASKTEPAPKTEPESTAEKPEKPEKPAASTKKGKGKAASAPAPAEDTKPKTKEEQALAAANESGDAEAIEKAKYDEVRSRVVGDEKLQALKQKAENAPTEEEGRKDLKAYNKALFQKMRSLDPSLKGRIDRMESAVLKQLDGTTQ
jgi:hypothetical protein